MEFGASSDQITDIDWASRSAATDGIYQEAKRILKGLGFKNYDLDSWQGRTYLSLAIVTNV